MVVPRSCGVGGGIREMLVKEDKLSVRRLISSEDQTHNVVITINNTVLCTSNLLRDWILTVLTAK